MSPLNYWIGVSVFLTLIFYVSVWMLFFACKKYNKNGGKHEKSASKKKSHHGYSKTITNPVN
ncbi:MAG: hypothetical protein ACJAT4_001638 [Granulosicoccus sp.]|jgi:hypothetical protein